MANIEFPKGIRFFEKHENAPDYIIGKISINKSELIEWLNTKDEKINLNVLLSKKDKPYLSVDNWKPKKNDNNQRNN